MFETKKLFNYDLNFKKVIVGIDEVGRGALAGPLVCCACIMNFNNMIDGIYDSKKLKYNKRKELYNLIIKNCIEYSFCTIDVNFINKYNINEATKIGMKIALNKLSNKYDIILFDYVANLCFEKKYISLKKGDSTSYSIAAASILAKVYRDEYMEQLAKYIPYYNFEKNKGYGTEEHILSLIKLGAHDQHRQLYIRTAINNMRNKIGILGEKKAQQYLLKNGYNILETNYSTKIGEIDIIAEKNNVLIFFEVKARSGEKYGLPCDAVNYKKIEKISFVASEYLQKNSKYFNSNIQFDVIEYFVTFDKINHIQNAFSSVQRF